jgi:hypothetical protein
VAWPGNAGDFPHRSLNLETGKSENPAGPGLGNGKSENPSAARLENPGLETAPILVRAPKPGCTNAPILARKLENRGIRTSNLPMFGMQVWTALAVRGVLRKRLGGSAPNPPGMLGAPFQ